MRTRGEVALSSRPELSLSIAKPSSLMRIHAMTTPSGTPGAPLPPPSANGESARSTSRSTRCMETPSPPGAEVRVTSDRSQSSANAASPASPVPAHSRHGTSSGIIQHSVRMSEAAPSESDSRSSRHVVSTVLHACDCPPALPATPPTRSGDDDHAATRRRCRTKSSPARSPSRSTSLSLPRAPQSSALRRPARANALSSLRSPCRASARRSRAAPSSRSASPEPKSRTRTRLYAAR
mmetsp:Transcript_22040/g.77256  ORF Transcript_22040/g.77256 Transcript_22040/m.77256 type:complete len:237 (-) Transcript_22040:2500-3210(-)